MMKAFVVKFFRTFNMMNKRVGKKSWRAHLDHIVLSCKTLLQISQKAIAPQELNAQPIALPNKTMSSFAQAKVAPPVQTLPHSIVFGMVWRAVNSIQLPGLWLYLQSQRAARAPSQTPAALQVVQALVQAKFRPECLARACDAVDPLAKDDFRFRMVLFGRSTSQK
jgi:hypothetical protein